MKWFLFLWTAGGLVAMNLAFPSHHLGEASWFLENASYLPFIFGTGFGLFQVVSGVLQKLRKVHP
jgi:hypothetical protein